MRQTDITFSSFLRKIGDEEPLLPSEKELIESCFVTKEYVLEHYPESIRLFFRTLHVNDFNTIRGEHVIEYVAEDEYAGHRNNDQLQHVHEKVHKTSIRLAVHAPPAGWEAVHGTCEYRRSRWAR